RALARNAGTRPIRAAKLGQIGTRGRTWHVLVARHAPPRGLRTVPRGTRRVDVGVVPDPPGTGSRCRCGAPRLVVPREPADGARFPPAPDRPAGGEGTPSRGLTGH